MVRIPGGRRLLVAVAAASLVPAIVVTGPARAIVTGPTAVDCTGTDDSALQTALTGAAAGQTITIDGMCTGEFTMATGTAIVLQGDPLTGAAEDGFDGETANGPLLAGTDVGATTVRDLIFRNGLSEGDGGALYLDGAVAPTVDGVLFESNQAGGEGGALFVSNDEATATGPMSIVDSTFEDNNTDTYGGAAFVSNWPSITVTGSTFLRNGADAGEDEGEVAPMEPGGGGLYLQVLSDLEGGSIESLDVDADVTITGSTFSGNNTDGSGAGLHVYSRGPESIEIADNTFGSGEAFESNRSELSGGGLYTYSTGPLSLTGNTFEANVAEGRGSEQIGGGGAHVLLAMSPDMTANGTLDAVDNTFFDNASLNDGGGLALQLTEGSTASLTGNDFDANRIDEDDDGGQSGHHGGGFFAELVDGCPGPCEGGIGQFGGQAVTAPLMLVGNTYTDNTVERARIECGEICVFGEVGGGGAWIANVSAVSRHNHYVGNTVTGDTGGAEGGGIGIEGGLAPGTTLHLQNDVVAGNTIDNGSGGGVYVGFSCGEGDPGLCGTALDIVNTTVSDNVSHLPGIAPGIGGGSEESPDDSLTMANSIVAGNNSAGEGEPEPDIGGFGSVTATYSDACTGAGLTGGPYEGTGNICADPLLVGPSTGDVHQTTGSPTIDAGSNALVPAELTEDIDGDARVLDGDKDGSAVVDMGADELVPAVETTETEETTETTETTEETSEDAEPTPGDGVTPPGSIGENDGYCLGAADGGVFAFGNCAFAGAADANGVRAAAVGAPSGAQLTAPMVGIAMTPDDKGYWMAGADGGVFAFGSAPFEGSLGGVTLQKPIVGIAATPTGNGYWLVASDGGVFAFGDATSHGSMAGVRLNQAIVGMAATPTGNGYWLVASDGGVFAFGDAGFQGSTGGIRLNQPVIGMAAAPGGAGYWLVAEDGGVFAFGSARFFGSFGSTRLNQPIVAIKGTSTGNGYWLVASDGGVFSFGSAPFRGSTGTLRLNQPIVDMTG